MLLSFASSPRHSRLTRSTRPMRRRTPIALALIGLCGFVPPTAFAQQAAQPAASSPSAAPAPAPAPGTSVPATLREVQVRSARDKTGFGANPVFAEPPAGRPARCAAIRHRHQPGRDAVPGRDLARKRAAQRAGPDHRRCRGRADRHQHQPQRFLGAHRHLPGRRARPRPVLPRHLRARIGRGADGPRRRCCSAAAPPVA